MVDKSRMITGSCHWSDTAENSNWENVIVSRPKATQSKALIRAFLAEHFDTPYFDKVMTLTRSELAPLRVAAARAGALDPANKTSSYVDRETKTVFSGQLADATFLPAPKSAGIVNLLDD